MSASKNTKPHNKISGHKTHFYQHKWFIVTVVGLLSIILAIAIAFKVSPWPGALVIRTVFNRGGAKTLAQLEQKLPNYPVKVIADQAYRAHDSDARLDVYIPQSTAKTNQTLPVVIWTHGGAWLSGNKKDATPYYKRLADQGFVVVALNYSLAPNKTYPTAIHQINDAHAYIVANAQRLHINPNKIVLSGDSAGAQLSSQMAALITSPSYAKEVGIQPSLKPSQLAGVLLYCGIYKMDALAHPDDTLPKIVGWGDDVSVWAYSGQRSPEHSQVVKQMSPYYHVNKDFPATFITGGNADPLTNVQSKPLADKLTSLGVDVTPLFYAPNHQPALPHEYQFTVNADGERAFTAMVNFLKLKTAP